MNMSKKQRRYLDRHPGEDRPSHIVNAGIENKIATAAPGQLVRFREGDSALVFDSTTGYTWAEVVQVLVRQGVLVFIKDDTGKDAYEKQIENLRDGEDIRDMSFEWEALLSIANGLGIKLSGIKKEVLVDYYAETLRIPFWTVEGIQEFVLNIMMMVYGLTMNYPASREHVRQDAVDIVKLMNHKFFTDAGELRSHLRAKGGGKGTEIDLSLFRRAMKKAVARHGEEQHVWIDVLYRAFRDHRRRLYLMRGKKTHVYDPEMQRTMHDVI